jgi:long-chain acyl-CoA synthetase
VNDYESTLAEMLQIGVQTVNTYIRRIYEKLQQGFEFRMKDSWKFQQWVYRMGMQRGRVLSDRRAAQGRLTSLADQLEFGFWYLALFRNMQRHMGLNRSHTRMCGGAWLSTAGAIFMSRSCRT